jgi:hypothetical protein
MSRISGARGGMDMSRRENIENLLWLSIIAGQADMLMTETRTLVEAKGKRAERLVS